jgi:lambda repressor-like predicted transcriptional regulator
MHEWRDWPADVVAEQLRKHGVIAAPVTVRVTLWWTGAKATLLHPKAPDDRRLMWQQVRDECQDVVAQLREMGLSVADVAAYLGVSHYQVEQAQKAWNEAAKATEKVKAA